MYIILGQMKFLHAEIILYFNGRLPITCKTLNNNLPFGPQRRMASRSLFLGVRPNHVQVQGSSRFGRTGD